MQLTDLVNLFWSVKEIGQGSKYFYEKLEDEITSKMRLINDDDLQVLIGCFSEANSGFS